MLTLHIQASMHGQLANSVRIPQHPKNGDDELQMFETSELTSVAGHACISYKGCLICWGGYGHAYYREPNFMYIYPYKLAQKSGVWFKFKVDKGDVPKKTTGAAAVVKDGKMYLFGGQSWDEEEDQNRAVWSSSPATSHLYSLDLNTGIWKFHKIPDEDKLPTPRDKSAAWATKNGLYFFAGYGPSWRRVNTSKYIFQVQDYFEDSDSYIFGNSWNNQLFRFTDKWERIEHGGYIPTPRAASGATYVKHTDKTYVFGGRHNMERLNDLYELDMKSFIWTKIDLKPAPEGRSWMTFTYNPDRNCVYMYGGLSSHSEPMQDTWILNIDTAKKELKWEKMPNVALPPRLWHCSVFVDGALISYGGLCASPPLQSDVEVVNTIQVTTFSPSSLMNLAMQKVSSNGRMLSLTPKHLWPSLNLSTQINRFLQRRKACNTMLFDDKILRSLPPMSL
uniref:Kelch domain-containing protein 2 n=1 Tax=Acrobeloides nanus TaxID=290746 RepID=A0A914CFR2_9BILA